MSHPNVQYVDYHVEEKKKGGRKKTCGERRHVGGYRNPA